MEQSKYWTAEGAETVLRCLADSEDMPIESLIKETGLDRAQAEKALRPLLDVWLVGGDIGNDFGITKAGRQLIERDGHIKDSHIQLAWPMDDLRAREAFAASTGFVISELRKAFAEGRGVELAAELAPSAFRHIVDEELALDLYAASVAVVVRLEEGSAPACYGEEIMGLVMAEAAKLFLANWKEQGIINAEEQESAASELQNIFIIYGDSDVLEIYDMKEPSDVVSTEVPGFRHWGSPEKWFDHFRDAGLGYNHSIIRSEG